MNINELTLFQLNALKCFADVRAMTETGLAKTLRSEKAVAAHAIRVLFDVGAVKKYGSWEYAITPEGVKALVDKGIISAKQKPTRQAKTTEDAVNSLTKTETSALLETIANSCASVVGVDVQADGCIAGEPIAELPTPERADFDTLVRQGMARLNRQLGLQPVVIERLELKIDTLGELARLIGPIDRHVEDLLLAIAGDLSRTDTRSSD